MLRARALVLVAALAISGDFGHKTLAAPTHVSTMGTFMRLDTLGRLVSLLRSGSSYTSEPLRLGLRGGEDDIKPAVVVPVGQQEMVAKPANPCKIYVGNLPMATTEAELKPFVEAAGSVLSIDIKKNKLGRCKGFALVEYTTAEEAKKAHDTLSGASFSNRSVLVRPQGLDPVMMAEKKVRRDAAIAAAKAATDAGAEPTRPRRKMQGHPHYWPRAVDGSRVYVGNIRFGTSWQEVRDHMAQAGCVEFGKIIKTPTTLADGSKRYVSRGFAIVQYASVEQATAATETLDQLPLNGRNLYVRIDQGRSKRVSSPLPPIQMEHASADVAA